ncbi:NADH-quinone oxidoreductase subunit C [Rickettsiales bacterium]|nr:NADH-quinone oxidoreductase subunit C [Rickettsiales bacterium]MDB2550604.1 NADH-quinone oxidoreductase subunit C [Rickettsiales bacterium]
MNISDQIQYIKKEQEQVIESINSSEYGDIIYVKKDSIINFLTFLRDDENLKFKMLIDLFGADLLGIRSPRFEVIYNLLSFKYNSRLVVKVALNDGESIATATKIFEAANWAERELFDMYGIKFDNHPDLRRLLTDYNFQHFPLRKDFPLTGYEEVRYDEDKKSVIYEKVNLTQEFRNFDFESPWSGIQNQLPGDEKADQ